MFSHLKQLIRELKLNMAAEWKQGKFNPTYPQKCINIKLNKPIIFRSSWEQRFFSFCDTNANVLAWASEVIEIPYIYDVDKKLHKYKPDVYVKMKNSEGKIVEHLIEIKPEKQLKKPKPPKNKTQKALRNFNYAMGEYIKNANKWKYARRYCETRSWDFKVLTEKQLF